MHLIGKPSAAAETLPDTYDYSDVEMINHQTLGEQVYQQLRQMLIAGRFHPGEKITLRSMAKALGTSPMPVRDALRQLMVEQSIELVNSRAFRVPIMTLKRFTEIRDIRLKLEGMAVQEAARKIGQDHLDEVRRVGNVFADECDRETPNRSLLIQSNQEFHFLIYRAADMPVLMRLIEGLWTQIGPVLNLDIAEGSARITNKVPVKHHNALVLALEQRDPSLAATALATDICAAGEHILNKGVLPDH